MSYIIQEPNNFINVKLTDNGRRLLSLGALTFKKVVLSDREINYNVGRNGYDICNNAVLDVKDDHPPIGNSSFNGTASVELTGQDLGSARQIVSALTNSIGFFTGNTNSGFTIATNADIQNGKPLGVGVIAYSLFLPNGGTEIILSSTTYTAKTGDLVFIPWEPPQYSAITNNTAVLYKDRPNVSLWYRVQDVTGNTLSLDRNIPNFGSTPIATSHQYIQTYFYPYNGIETYYGSSTTINTGVWNMNIVRTTTEIGTPATMSGYTSYGSLEYNGTKKYLGFSSETKSFGIIHYTNQFTGNTYAEQLVEGTIEINIPNIMWHGISNTSPVGNELNYGLTLYDVAGDSFFDTAAQTTYRELRDSVGETGNVVGRVYHKLKIFVITDQELLTALTYKSNRNYTLPTPQVTVQSSPPSSHPDLTGLCKSGYTYYVSYIVSSNSYEATSSYGYPQPFQFTDYTLAPIVPDNTAPQFLKVEFPVNSFPFMRNSTNIVSLSGTGWNANKLQILVKEYPVSAATNVGDLPTTDWRLISNGIGNGIYTGETGDTTIDPVYLQAKSFIISQEDYDSGTTYSLTGQYSGFTMNSDLTASGLTFGSETFFYGNVTAGIMSTVYKTVITIYAKNNEYNSSDNESYDSLLDENTYITEIGILDDDDNLVAVGKPSYPIKKNSSRYLSFQMELDF